MILEKILYGSLQIESLNKSSFVECESVSNTAHLNSLRLHAYTEFRMFSDASFYHVGDVFQGRCKVLQSVVTQSNVVGEVGVIPGNLLGCLKNKLLL